MHTSPSGTGRVTAEEAAERTGGAAGSWVLLDVRESDEWRAGHAPGAVHVPLYRLAEGVPLPPEAQGRGLVVICRSGNRSRRAAELLAHLGIEAVDVIGGLHAWARAGLPVVDGRGRPGTVA
ncbi:rhodanese-like domain-containing protein [Streptomyces sp. enrichment culture]|uniref:rhodanese-like domain-containing protein n=1 Tax=Streptomyces sp. enrichment culture TaxID=1795815 RepID=UPI003F54580D